ncbi:MAG: acetyl-CoA carboxylase carboxyltransferase component [Gammaproteobacteria bacterium]|jgi:acetyl-CoA carboxylase carboxyltransferase component
MLGAPSSNERVQNDYFKIGTAIVSQKEWSEAFRKDRDRIRTEMGGQARVERIHERGGLTIRDRVDKLFDADSFTEIGTFARSVRPQDRESTPGDGKIGGAGRIDGRIVYAVGDDLTVKHGSSSQISSKRMDRIYEQAVDNGHPFVYFGETGGARLPDTLGSEGFSLVSPSINMSSRGRAIPMACAIVGQSFGGSSFKSAMSDFVVQTRGSCLAVTSPRVIEIATGETIDFETLGGVDVHDRLTGQIDRVADDEEQAIELIQQWLAFMPSNAWEVPKRLEWDGDLSPDTSIYDLVPTRRTRGYDMRRVLETLTDDGTIFELKPNFGRSTITALGRIAGRVVGFIASNPMFLAGALTPESCDKDTSFVCMCDAFNIPLILMQDVPGFMVGRQVEHSRILSKAIMFQQALVHCQVPRITVVLRKAFGLAYFSLGGGSALGAASVVAWPGAEISFMDPQVGVNVVYAERLKQAQDPQAERERLVSEWSSDTGPFGAAGIMEIDEIIDPAETRSWLRQHMDSLRIAAPSWGVRKPLSWWPTCY